MKITTLQKATKEGLKDINILVGQVRKSLFTKGTLSELRDIVNDKKIVMVIAKDGQRIIGMASLYLMQKVGKRNGHVEDVVVDNAYRGQGLGKKLMHALIAIARVKRVNQLHLTTRSSRKAANRLYQKLGFKLHKTNPYQMNL